MRQRIFRRRVLHQLATRPALWALGAVLIGSTAALAGPDPAIGAESFRREIRPILEEFCFDCHGDGAKKGNVALALLIVGGIAALDYRAAQNTKPLRPARDARRKLYPNRSGYPRGIEGARSAARQIAHAMKSNS